MACKQPHVLCARVPEPPVATRVATGGSGPGGLESVQADHVKTESFKDPLSFGSILLKLFTALASFLQRFK